MANYLARRIIGFLAILGLATCYASGHARAAECRVPDWGDPIVACFDNPSGVHYTTMIWEDERRVRIYWDRADSAGGFYEPWFPIDIAAVFWSDSPHDLNPDASGLVVEKTLGEDAPGVWGLVVSAPGGIMPVTGHLEYYYIPAYQAFPLMFVPDLAGSEDEDFYPHPILLSGPSHLPADIPLMGAGWKLLLVALLVGGFAVIARKKALGRWALVGILFLNLGFSSCGFSGIPSGGANGGSGGGGTSGGSSGGGSGSGDGSGGGGDTGTNNGGGEITTSFGLVIHPGAPGGIDANGVTQGRVGAAAR